MTYDEGLGITAFEYGEELTEGGTLCGGSCVGGLTEDVESSFVAYADGMGVMVFAMGSDLVFTTSGLDGAVATYDIMIADAVFPTSGAVPEVYLTCRTGLSGTHC